MSQTIIFHLDLDTFFVSVERLFDPRLEGKPVIVGADPTGRGVVAACSYEARRYGVHSAMPIRQAYRLCPHAEYLHGHHGEYSRYSKLVRKILEKYPPFIEQASVDEFYMDFTGTRRMYGPYHQLAERMQREVWDELRLPCSIGIGGNKTIAKIASDFNKPRGITYVEPGMEKDFLAPMPVQVIPGVGRKMLPQLQSKGIYKVADITALPLDYFAAAFGKSGIDLWHKAQGEGTEYLTIEREQKSISKERTYGEDVAGRDILEQTLFKLTGQVCQTLRDQDRHAATVTLKLRYSDFVTVTRSKTIRPDDDDQVIYNTALEMLGKAYTRRVAVRLIGIGVSKFTQASEQQILFEDQHTQRSKALKAVNSIRSKFGYESILVGGTA